MLEAWSKVKDSLKSIYCDERRSDLPVEPDPLGADARLLLVRLQPPGIRVMSPEVGVLRHLRKKEREAPGLEFDN